MSNRKKEIVNIIKDLSDKDQAHLLLEPYEIAAVRILKTTGEISYRMMSPDGKTSDDEIMIEYSLIRPYIVNLYIDLVLIVGYVGVGDFTDMDMSGKLKKIKDTFGLKLVVLMQNTVGAMLEGLEKENSVLFGAALKILHAFIFSILDMYNVPEDDFYIDVEDSVYTTLTEGIKNSSILSASKLKLEFKGERSVTLSVKIDKRKTLPFVGFIVTIESNKSIVFKGSSPYKVFLQVSTYIDEVTNFRDIGFRMDLRTRHFLNKYSIMYAKEDQLIEKMSSGFYPVLVPKGATNIEEFLDALTK